MWRFLAILIAIPGASFAACGADDAEDAAPTRDTGPLPTATDAQVQALTRVAVPGFETADTGETLLGAAVTYKAGQKTAGGADLFVRANFVPCDDFVCQSLDPGDYSSAQAQDGMKSVLPSAHKANPDLLWEFGAVQLSKDAEGLYYYALSYLEESTGGGTSRSSANSYRAWYHNGSVYVTLEVFARGPDSPLSKADVERTMTKGEAEQAAKEVFAALEPELPR